MTAEIPVSSSFKPTTCFARSNSAYRHRTRTAAGATQDARIGARGRAESVPQRLRRQSQHGAAQRRDLVRRRQAAQPPPQEGSPRQVSSPRRRNRRLPRRPHPQHPLVSLAHSARSCGARTQFRCIPGRISKESPSESSSKTSISSPSPPIPPRRRPKRTSREPKPRNRRNSRMRKSSPRSRPPA